jgi:hypothetical protein
MKIVKTIAPNFCDVLSSVTLIMTTARTFAIFVPPLEFN